MFTVYEKGIWENDERLHATHPKSVEVYAVRDDNNGFPHFLICENGEWKYRSAKYFTNKPMQYVWRSRENLPEAYRDIIVREANDREYNNHYWTGHAYYRYVESDDGSRDGWPSNVHVVSWRYKD